MSEERTLTILVVPDHGNATRTFRISYRRLRSISLAGFALLLVVSAMVGSWWYLAARAQRATELEREVAAFALDREQIATLAAALSEVEEGYERLRSLFGADVAPGSSEVWLPPAAGRPSPLATRGGASAAIPASWPLAERGFITQNLFQGGVTDHPGIDIAVPAGSYIRASGSGVVAEAGEDPVYGLFVILDHAQGFRTLYAHASVLMVAEGDEVRQNEVIALSGSTGRSSAPHLHFEILRNGEPIDPLSMVTPP